MVLDSVFRFCWASIHRLHARNKNIFRCPWQLTTSTCAKDISMTVAFRQAESVSIFILQHRCRSQLDRDPSAMAKIEKL